MLVISSNYFDYTRHSFREPNFMFVMVAVYDVVVMMVMVTMNTWRVPHNASYVGLIAFKLNTFVITPRFHPNYTGVDLPNGHITTVQHIIRRHQNVQNLWCLDRPNHINSLP